MRTALVPDETNTDEEFHQAMLEQDTVGTTVAQTGEEQSDDFVIVQKKKRYKKENQRPKGEKS